MKHIKLFENFEGEKECKWCYKKFTPEKKFQDCCCSECDGKYNNYLGNDGAKAPWSKYTESKIYDYKILPKEAIKELEMYVNVDNPSNKIEVYPDPQVEGTYALRITRNEHGHTHPEVFTLLWNKGGYDEIDFDEFPPKSGNLKFFI